MFSTLDTILKSRIEKKGCVRKLMEGVVVVVEDVLIAVK